MFLGFFETAGIFGGTMLLFMEFRDPKEEAGLGSCPVSSQGEREKASLLNCGGLLQKKYIIFPSGKVG